jgi:hypothetical protein
MRRHLGKQRQAGLLPGPGSKDSYQGYTAARQYGRFPDVWPSAELVLVAAPGPTVG